MGEISVLSARMSTLIHLKPLPLNQIVFRGIHPYPVAALDRAWETHY